jgi:hypothetical protein
MEVRGYVTQSDDEYGEWASSEFSCLWNNCGATIEFAEDVCAISVYTIGMTSEGMHFLPLVADDGDYLYEPGYFCAECWKYVMDELRICKEDIPPILDEYAVCECSMCASGIREGEVFGLAIEGQVHLSQRCPDDSVNSTFHSVDGSPTIICIACMNTIERDITEIYGSRLTQHKECEEGSFIRCWRHGCDATGHCSRAHPKETS